MKVIGLISGGKDSCYNLIKCIQNGHKIVALLNLIPQVKDQDEINSFMYQTVGYQALKYYSKAIDLPLFQYQIKGKPVNVEIDYQKSENDEVEDLFQSLKYLKEEKKIDFEAIAVGAISSNYQKKRAENVCQRLGLHLLSFLWNRDQHELLKEMIQNGLEAIIIKVAAMGLNQSHLGMNLSQIYPILVDLNKKYDVNFCGEGGEYETFTLDCSFFKKRLQIDQSEKIVLSNDAFAPVAYLRTLKIIFLNK